MDAVDRRRVGGISTVIYVTLRAGEATMISDKRSRPMAPHRWSEEKTARAVATIGFPKE